MSLKVEEQGRDLLGKIEALKDSEQTLTTTQNVSIFGLAKLAESRDKATGKHLARIQIFSNLIAQEIVNSNGKQSQAFPPAGDGPGQFIGPTRRGQGGHTR